MISKIIEKVVAVRLQKYLEANQLNEPLQSAYKPFHRVKPPLCAFIIDCKTVRIFACSSTRNQSNIRSETRLKTESETGERRVRLASSARVKLLRHALPIFLLISRKKPTALQSTFIIAFWLLLINVTVSCFYCKTCLLPSTLWITITSLQYCTLNTQSLA